MIIPDPIRQSNFRDFQLTGLANRGMMQAHRRCILSRKNFTPWILLGVLSLIWGSSFILIKKSLEGLTPLQTGSLRVLIAALVFVPWVLIRRKRIPWQRLAPVLAFALCEVGIPPYLYALAQTKVSSGTAGILNSLVPLFTLVTGAIFFAIPAARRDAAGVLLGFGGAVILVGGGGFVFHARDLLGLLIVLATLLYAFGGNIIQTRLASISPLDISALAFVSMGIPSLFVLLIEGVPAINPVTAPSLMAVTLLALVGSAGAIVLFSRLIHLSGALFASFVTYLIPVAALGWAVLDGEVVTPRQLIALAGILGGVALVNRRRRPPSLL